MTLAAAATQFEALMIAQMLKESHGDGGGWLGGGDEAGAATEAGLAEEQFAQALAQNGGLGLRSCLLAGLSQRSK